MTDPGFHGFKRAPKASRPTITVQCAETELKSLLLQPAKDEGQGWRHRADPAGVPAGADGERAVAKR